MDDIARLLRIPAPIHSEDDDPASPPPSWILLDPYGYLSVRTNGTTAEGFTTRGKSILVTFWPATPPRVSCFTVYCPDLKPSAFCALPKALYSHDDLVLLRTRFRRAEDTLHYGDKHYFVYQANPPSLKFVPMPPCLNFPDREVALLRCRDQDMFYMAVLVSVFDCHSNQHQFHLHLYNSNTGAWNTKLMHVDSPNNISYSYASIVLPIGGEFASVGWFDLWRGILICDLLLDNHRLRYIPLPLPLVPLPLRGHPMSIRNIIVLEGYIRYFEMRYDVRVRPGSNTGCTCAGTAEGWVAVAKKMKISDIGSGNNWEEDFTIKFSEIPVDSPKLVQMLPNLKKVTDTKITLKRVRASYPVLSLQDPDVVYFMHTPDPDKEKALLLAVDMRNKTIKGMADFGFGRPVGYAFTYLQSGITKHLSAWSSR